MSPLPILFLNVEQGPKAGCRLECNAAAISTVGRARSNTLQISRDTGISQKHLCFQWSDGDKDDVQVGWVALDAGSSNGTIINGVLIEPHKEIYTHTGDLIKIGSETTIRVEILGGADEIMAVSKAKESSKRMATCIASESHDKGIAGRQARKAGRVAGKALPVLQESEGRRLDVMEPEVYPGKHHIHFEEKGHGKQKHGTTSEVSHGKQHSTLSEGHDKQQDKTAGEISGNEHTNSSEGHDKQGGSMTAERHCQSKHDINSEAEVQGKQLCRTRAEKHGISSAAECMEDSTAEVSRDHEHETKIVAPFADIDLSITVEQWFRHLMEEGPKYLYKVSESIIQDVMLESKQFDKYVLSLS